MQYRFAHCWYSDEQGKAQDKGLGYRMYAVVDGNEVRYTHMTTDKKFPDNGFDDYVYLGFGEFQKTIGKRLWDA